ncbi:MAG: hypothetical protein HY332_13355 [Chloroflexi bacterium]|nr:hypothetical protein [Chloroflexota bacterium]
MTAVEVRPVGAVVRPLVLLDPTVEPEPEVLRPASRPASLAGLTVGLIDNSKPNAAAFLERLAARLQQEYGVAGIRWIHKKSAGRPALDEEYDALAQDTKAAIAAIGD